MPTDLIGTWRTNHPRYAGLYFQIEKDKFAFSTAEGTVENYSLARYEKLETGQKRKVFTHVLHGKRDGQQIKVSFFHEPRGGGVIRFQNRYQIPWNRDAGQAP